MLVNPQLVHETDTPEQPIQMDFSQPNVVGIKKGDKVIPVDMKISKDFYDVMTILGQKLEESTVSKVVAGQSPGGVTAASGINLLIGGGKLTVSSVQKAMGEVRASSTGKLFDFLRAYKQFEPLGDANLELLAGGRYQQLTPEEIPERMDIKVNYQPFMPQDRALAVQTWLEPLMQEIISSDFFYEQVGVQDAVTLRRQIEQDRDRKVAAQQFQQQVDLQAQQDMMSQAQQAQIGAQQPQAEAQPGIGSGMNAEDVGMGEQPLEQVTPNPQAENSVVNELNAMQNALSNPMSQ
jgi:hypothetical protein